MGLMGAARERKAETAQMATASVEGCPDPLTHYVTEVNKGSVNMLMLGGTLNAHYQRGYRLAQAFEQGGNVICVFEHNHA